MRNRTMQGDGVRLGDRERELVRRYVADLNIPERKWKVFNGNYQGFRDLVVSLPNCRDFGDIEVTSIVVDALLSHRPDPGVVPDETSSDLEAKRLIEFIESLPRKYSVQVALPGMPDWGSYTVTLSRNLTLRGTAGPRQSEPNNALMRTLFAEDNREPGSRVHLECSVNGYISTSPYSPDAAEVVAILKQAAFLLVFTEAASHEGWTRPRPTEAFVTDSRHDENETFPLPMGLARHLGGLDVSTGLAVWELGETILTGRTREPANEQEWIEAFRAKTAPIRTFFSRSHLPGYSRMTAAIEWYQDSLLHEDETMAFLAACIGLETIFGEDDGGMSELSKRLMDRYAFMLGKDREERSRLSQEFGEVLKVRGHLVHARETRLKAKDRKQLVVVRRMLLNSIRHEIRPFMAAEA